jgi:hypothetical protein
MKQTLPFSRLSLFIACFLSVCALRAQDSLWQSKPEINFSAYLDVFYAFDLNRPQADARQPFLYNHNRHNEFNLNNGIIKINVAHPKYRANLALHAGTYVEDNYANEPASLKYLYEANVGLGLNKKQNLWLDAGIFASHIGFESAISIDNLTLTRSLLAENSPYFLSGLRFTYTPTPKWTIVALVCNGWQRIRRQVGNTLPALGTQITYAASPKFSINWSSFTGADTPDSVRLMRYFHNFYAQGALTDKLKYIVGFDFGMQQSQYQSHSYNTWLSPAAIISYQWHRKWATTLRGEYYQDPNAVITSPNNQGVLRCFSASINLDYKPTPNIACRLEARYFQNKDAIFAQHDGGFSPQNFVFYASLAARLMR